MYKLTAFALLSALAGVSASANPVPRQHYDTFVVQKPNCTTMNDFGAAFSGWCPHYLAANGTNVSFLESQFFPGSDSQGTNSDTQATVNCVWTINNPGSNGVQESTDVSLALVRQLGGQGLSFDGISFDDFEF